MSVIANLKARMSRESKQAIKDRLPGTVSNFIERAGSTQADQITPLKTPSNPTASPKPATAVVVPTTGAKNQPVVATVKPKIVATPPPPAAAAAAKLNLADAIATYEKSSLTLNDLSSGASGGPVDLFTLARACSKYGNTEKALRCLDHIPEEEFTLEQTQFATKEYARVAQFETALRLLDRLNPLDLSNELRRKFDLQRMNYLRMLGRMDRALEIGEQLMEEFPNSIEVKLIYADTLAIDSQNKKVNDLYLKLISAQSYPIQVAEKYLDFLYVTNNLSGFIIYYTAAGDKFRNSIALQWRLCRHYWTTGESKQFAEACERLQQLLKTGRLPLAAIGFFASLQEDEDWPHIIEIKDIIYAQIESRRRPIVAGVTSANLDQAISLLNDALAMESEDDIESLSDAICAKFPFVSRGWYGKGVVAASRNDYATAETLFRRAIELDQSREDSYNALFNLLANRNAPIEEMEQLIAVRNEFSPKYQDHYPNGRARFFDRETFFLDLLKKDFKAAYAQRDNQPPNQYLSLNFPEQYAGFESGALPDEKGGSICVLGQDGVGDEIRWARYYAHLKDYYDTVRISCDPRLEGIFKRSFPDYKFMPLARRWPSVPWRAQEVREEVPLVTMAGKLSGPVMYQMSEADRIMFLEEVAYHVWDRDEANHGPMIPHKQAYLKPDEERADYWRSTLEADAGKRLKIGLLWRSSLLLKKRTVHYMTARDLAPLARHDCHFVSLQPKMSMEEEQTCRRLGIEIYPDLDLYDGFEDIAAITSELDLVIGVSTLPLEMAAAMGTECWVMNFASYGNAIRLGTGTGNDDVFSSNSTVISGAIDGSFAFPQRKLIDTAMAETVSMLKARLAAE